MGIFSKSQTKDELVLVFDIRSSSVGGALFYKTSSGAPKIAMSVREPVAFEEKVSVDRLLSLTIKSLEVVAKKLSTSGLGAPSQVFCVLSSPWYISHTRVINLKKDTPFVFTSKLSNSLIEKEVGLLEEEYMQKYEHVGTNLRPIELKNIKISLNGYETSNPINKSTSELSMTIFVSLSSEDFCKNIEDAIKKYFHVADIKFCSFTLASFAVVRDMYATEKNFLLINIGGEVTDISMIKDSSLRESTSFPLGENFLVRGVSSGIGLGLNEAKSFVSLFKDGHASDSTAKSMDSIIMKLRADWLKSFQESLANISNDISIPSLIFLFTDGAFTNFFSDLIKSEQFNQYTLTESKFQISPLSVENLHDIALFDKSTPFDSFLGVETVYISRFFK